MTSPQEIKSRTVLAIASGKGGIGKSLLAACLRGILSTEYKVLLVDMDLSVKGLTFLYGSADFWETTRGSLMDYPYNDTLVG